MLELLSLDMPVPTTITSRSPSISGGESNLQRERLFNRLKERSLPGISHREVNRHFRGMPARYWERVTKSELIWGLETVHAFNKKVGSGSEASNTVVADARHCPERGFAKVMICSWDRPGLLAKIAAAFSALRINILRADVYTRADGVALDLFEVSDLPHHAPASAEWLQHLIFLLEGALINPPRFVSLWASQFHKAVERPAQTGLHVEFDNDSSPDYTIVRVETDDRLGLLHDLLRALTDCGLNITQALVETSDGLASDAFYVTDVKGPQIYESGRLERIRRALQRFVLS